MEKILDRFLRYVKVDTQSNEDSQTQPSTSKQLNLLKLLCKELNDMGVEATLDEYGYVMGRIPANVPGEHPAIGFIAHVDTAPDALLSVAYANDMQTLQGRARWHGGAPVSEFRTNETTSIIERVDIYPDGWVYIDPASRRKALTPEEAAARAASRRTAKQARIDSLRAQLDALREQLTVPATNDELIVSQAQARIRIASIQRTLDRLTAPISTNEVVITVTPPSP